MIRVIRNTILLLIIVSCSACGFELRGSNLEWLAGNNIYISAKPGSDLALELKRQLSFADINVHHSSTNADYVIALSEENFERNILSVSSDTAKVEEYELIATSRLSISGADSEKLLDNEPVLARREYIFDQDSVLGKFDEVEKIQEEMYQQMSASIIRKLRAVTH